MSSAIAEISRHAIIDIASLISARSSSETQTHHRRRFGGNVASFANGQYDGERREALAMTESRAGAAYRENGANRRRAALLAGGISRGSKG